ncbi:reverse transcriptase domain-containing protein [Tanacetum coccineum]|uniref:Reverse transcriptase domain-containing protein n=1 Tax=Tanacetum coccineum TaxID=301880 RepID=A0ABQ4WQX7_9ASTR
MWSNIRTVAPTPSSAIIQRPISTNFRIKGTHMQMIWDNQFDGRIRSDPHRHVADFLEISNLFQYGENQEEAVMLRTFHFSLCEEAKIWLNELNEGTITSWNELREAFISRYFSRKLKEMQDSRRDNHALDDYLLMDDTPMCEPNDVNYVQRYHEGYHDHEPINSYFYLNHNPNRHYPYPQNQMPRPSRYFEFTETSTEEMMREWMTSQTEANERMKNQVVELKNQINQGLRNHQSIIQNLERQFRFLLPTESLPRTTNTKLRHEFVYKPPSIRNNNDKGDVKFIKVDETQLFPTMPNPNPIEANSPTVSPFPKDFTMHILYTDAKSIDDVVLLNHVGEKEFKSIVGN